MREPATVPIRYAQSLLRLANLPTDELQQDLQELKLPLVLLKDKALPEAQMSAEDYGRLFIHLVRKLQPDLQPDDTELDSALKFSAYRMLYLAMAHSNNLQQALQRAAVYFRRFEAHGESFRLEIEDGEVCCRFEFAAEDEHEGRPAVDVFDMGQLNWLHGLTGRVISISMWHRLCSWFIGNTIDLSRVDLAQAAPAEPEPYQHMFAAPLNFAADSYACYFSARYLEFPVVQGEDAVDQLLLTYPAELLKLDPAKSASLSARVRGLVGTDFTRELPTLQQVADRLFMTTPTLHRRLQQEGTSYQVIKDHCRRDVALQKLQLGDFTSNDLAELLGFSDSSTFHRAFKKWTGMTPVEYRQSMLRPEPAAQQIPAIKD